MVNHGMMTYSSQPTKPQSFMISLKQVLAFLYTSSISITTATLTAVLQHLLRCEKTRNQMCRQEMWCTGGNHFCAFLPYLLGWPVSAPSPPSSIHLHVPASVNHPSQPVTVGLQVVAILLSVNVGEATLMDKTDDGEQLQGLAARSSDCQ